MKCLFILCLCFLSAGIKASDASPSYMPTGNVMLIQKSDGWPHLPDTVPEKRARRRENPRVIAAILCASLGLFGVHRMYLGTDVRVPVFYTLTFGGGVVLWIADLGIILFSRSLEPYMDNTHVFMWKEK